MDPIPRPARADDAPFDAGAFDAALTSAIANHRDRPGGLMPLLHDLQHALGWIPSQAIEPIAAALNLSRAEVHGVVTYYPDFHTTPLGRHRVQVCRAESCLARGGDALLEQVRDALACDLHETRADGHVTLEPVYCLGLCAGSPALMVDGRPYARVDAPGVAAIATLLEEQA